MADVDSGAGSTGDMDIEDPCAISNSDSHFGLRVGAIFIILVTSLAGTLTPILFRHSSVIPTPVFDFAKYFGSGVIIATAFIHLLAPAWDELTSECLSGAWTDYDWAPAIAMAAVYGIFFAEVAAYRIGTRKLERLGVNYSSHAHDETDAHAHNHNHDPPLSVDTSVPAPPHHLHPSASHIQPHEETDPQLQAAAEKRKSDVESGSEVDTVNQLPSKAEASAQLVGVAVLEFGVVLHSVIIGLTLGVTDEFTTLFIVIIFHQMFEGLGLGSRLAALNLPKQLNYARWAAALFYAICTPIGIAIGIGARHSYNGNGATANIVSGVLDATSAGILLYTGLVELMAHEILLNPRMMKARDGKLAYIFICMLLGSGLMALLGRWA